MAKTLVFAALKDGEPPEEVWVHANDGSTPDRALSILEGAELYLLWHQKSLARLGIEPGPRQTQPGAKAVAPDGTLRAGEDGAWEETTTPPILAGLPLFAPPGNCDLLIEGQVEAWPEIRPFTSAARTGPTAMLFGGDDGVLYHYRQERGVEVVADLAAPLMAVAVDSSSRAYALDEQFRLHAVPLGGGPTTTISTSTAGFNLAPTSVWTMAQLAIQPDGEVHLLAQYRAQPMIPVHFEERVARLSGTEWVRWNEPECGPEDPQTKDGHRSRRLTTTSDGSVLAVGNCRHVILRWRNNLRYEPLLDSVVVRELRGQSFVATAVGGLLEDRNRSGEWGTIITAGGRPVLDLVEAPLEGILTAGFDNRQTVTKVVLAPPPGEVAPELCPLTNIAWPGATTELLQLGEVYLVRTINPTAVLRFSLSARPD